MWHRFCIILVRQQRNDLSTAGGTFADILIVKQLNYGTCIKVLKPGNILPAAEKITA